MPIFYDIPYGHKHILFSTLSLSHSPMLSGPGFLSMSPESRMSSISDFITDCREVVTTKHSTIKKLFERTGTLKEEEEEEEEEE